MRVVRLNHAVFAVLCTMLLVAGCAGTGGGNGIGPGATPDKSKRGGAFGLKSLKTGTFRANGLYSPSNEERSQSCKRITGKMGVRIEQLRRSGTSSDTSTLAQKFGGYFGGQSRGTSQAVQRKRERAVLNAYNAILAEKKCPTIDIDKRLAKPVFGGSRRREAWPDRNSSNASPINQPRSAQHEAGPVKGSATGQSFGVDLTGSPPLKPYQSR